MGYPQRNQSNPSELEKALLQLTKSSNAFNQSYNAFIQSTNAFLSRQLAEEESSILAQEDHIENTAPLLKQLTEEVEEYSEWGEEQECKEADLVNSFEASNERSIDTSDPMVNMQVDHSLYDVETTMNQRPMTLLEKMGIEHIRSAKMTLQLPDCSIQVSVCIAENVLVKAGNFAYTESFAVIDLDDDPAISHFFEEPLVAIIDLVEDELKDEAIYKVNGDKVSILDFTINSPSLAFFPSDVQAQYVEDKRGGRTRLKNPHLLKTKSKPKVKIKKSKKMTMTMGSKAVLVLCYKPP